MFKPDKIIVSPKILAAYESLMGIEDPRREEQTFLKYMMKDLKTYYGHCEGVLVDVSILESPYYRILKSYL